MRFLFETLINHSMKQAIEYIAWLVNFNKSYEAFEAIPLLPTSYSCSGSCVPLYASWVENLEKLSPIFSGLDYLNHKERVAGVIDSLRKQIVEEEISDILNG